MEWAILGLLGINPPSILKSSSLKVKQDHHVRGVCFKTLDDRKSSHYMPKMLAVSGKTKDNAPPKRFLRRPLVPKVLPKLPLTPPPDISTGTKSLAGEFLVEPEFYYEEGEYGGRPEYMFDRSGTSPPPPSEHHTSSSHKHKSGTVSTAGFGKSTITRHSYQLKVNNGLHGRFILDPLYREQTSLGTYVEGKSLVQPLNPRGPAPLPARLPMKCQLPLAFMDTDEIMEEKRYNPPPLFTLRDFLQTVSEKEDVPLVKVQEIMYSKHNYVKIQNLLAEHLAPKYPVLTTVKLEPEVDQMPTHAPRIPQQQLLIEMAALIKEQMSNTVGTTIRPLIRKLPKFSPDYKPGKPIPHTEIVLYEDNTDEARNKFQEQTRHSEPDGTDKLLNSPTSRYFQGSRRSAEPFNLPEDESITPAEMAVLDCLVNGGTALSIKAMFISHFPDIELLLHTITYLNFSFNDFEFIPYEVFELEHLTTLKMRNNPIREIPEEIKALKKLRVLVFSFCLVTELPKALFSLKKLYHLDLSYNKVTILPPEIRKLKQLRELNVEGNHLPAFPKAVLRLQILRYVRVNNNYMHPLFWREHSRNSAQRLIDMALRIVFVMDHTYGYPEMPETVRKQMENYTKCDCCRGVRYGDGLKIIRPVSKVFGIKNLPIMFFSCSPDCLDHFKYSQDDLVELLYGPHDEK